MFSHKDSAGGSWNIPHHSSKTTLKIKQAVSKTWLSSWVWASVQLLQNIKLHRKFHCSCGTREETDVLCEIRLRMVEDKWEPAMSWSEASSENLTWWGRSLTLWCLNPSPLNEDLIPPRWKTPSLSLQSLRTWNRSSVPDPHSSSAKGVQILTPYQPLKEGHRLPGKQQTFWDLLEFKPCLHPRTSLALAIVSSWCLT